MQEKQMNIVKIVSILVILVVGVIVALSPGLVYAPTPKMVLYFLISILTGLLFGAEAAAKFDFKLPGFCLSATGAIAVCFGALLLLTKLSKPEEQIAVYQIYDEQHEPVALDWPGALQIPVTPQGLTVTKFIDGNNIILVFPEQVGQVELRVKKSFSSRTYSNTITYAGTRTSKLILGEDLK